MHCFTDKDPPTGDMKLCFRFSQNIQTDRWQSEKNGQQQEEIFGQIKAIVNAAAMERSRMMCSYTCQNQPGYLWIYLPSSLVEETEIYRRKRTEIY